MLRAPLLNATTAPPVGRLLHPPDDLLLTPLLVPPSCQGECQGLPMLCRVFSYSGSDTPTGTEGAA